MHRWRPSLLAPTAVAAVAAFLGFSPAGEAARAGPAAAAPVEAYFARDSYRTGRSASLYVRGQPGSLEVQVFRIGPVSMVGQGYDELRGVPVTAVIRRLPVAAGGGETRLDVRIGEWASGLYFAKLRTPGGRLGYATFVVAPRRLGEHRVAVVMPTNTWHAYNGRDDDGDGLGDTWYADPAVRTVDTTRPFPDRGVPPHFRDYDRAFLRWLAVRDRGVDVLSDRELERVANGVMLRAAYDLIVFPGHHEYVTAHVYDAVERFRDLGGNLMFLSANSFYWKVEKTPGTMTRTIRWRDLGRPESALVGAQYVTYGYRLAPYVVRRSRAGAWVFAGTGLEPGDRFGNFGYEIDRVTSASPPGTQVLAEIPDLLGPGLTAQMTYYTTRCGAKVFAAGAFTLGGAAMWPAVSRILDNLWARLAPPDRDRCWPRLDGSR